MIRFGRRSQAVAGLTTARIMAFSDGVFAIAITLLVLNLQVPRVPVSELVSRVLALWPNFLSYLLSVVIIGISILSPLVSLIVFFLFPLYYIFPSHIDLHLTPTSHSKEEAKEGERTAGENISLTEDQGEEAIS